MKKNSFWVLFIGGLLLTQVLPSQVLADESTTSSASSKQVAPQVRQKVASALGSDALTEALSSYLKKVDKSLTQAQQESLTEHLKNLIKQLQTQGWTDDAIAYGFFEELSSKGNLSQLKAVSDQTYEKSQIFGSQTFQALWFAQADQLSSTDARQALALVYQLVGLPSDLSGKQEETRQLIARFSDDLDPASSFWDSFSQVVQTAFPKKTLSEETDIARKTHQFRYVISAQQAQWVRQNYGKSSQSDKDALARYLATKDEKDTIGEVIGIDRYDYDASFDLTESSRLHNKIALEASQFGRDIVVYPDYTMSSSIKIVMDFHTEFIINSQGQFLNEIDPDLDTEVGIVNGASFNYADANDATHRRLDVKPVAPNDPSFRKDLGSLSYHYKAPNKLKYIWQENDRLLWENSYFNKEGNFSRDGKSAASLVKESAKSFKKLIERYRK
ncbi:DUF3114 domain-containing protein [Streptococcus saliviloxodontae]|uniref:Uncharacterized membrane protein YheB (UPF0754 family) n=1 Tax=Streptococcus saliviloxodontae TaxID=1349416 RepID=A0ABS2PLL3_9STRE|nr:DUF3114 domain-containing protein [Streptococcus saliviloxodontae]MBM7635683.1 uncharacterized membrane protein YheB (UPF0754 family) [Streptococcus saliviloxodontae]